MYARATTIEGRPDAIDEAVRQGWSWVRPPFRGSEGFKGLTLPPARPSWKGVGTSFWEGPEAMAASEEAVRGPREDAARRGGATSAPTVEHFEVLIDTMES